MNDQGSNGLIKISIFLNYFVFAILLNSVGIVILQVQNNFGVTESAASVLEGFKDLTIAIFSFFVATYITRIGYRRAMMIALGFIIVVSLAMPSIPSFWSTKLLFFIIGISFALTKVSVFASLGLVTKDEKDHISTMNFLESFFMVGVLSGYFLFSGFIDNENVLSTSWFKVYYLIAGISLVALVLLFFAPLDESSIASGEDTKAVDDIGKMLKLIIRPLVLIFVVSVFLYVLIEQGIMSWLPTFNQNILNLPTSLSIQMASILAGSTALGRFLGGIVLKKVHWYPVLCACLIGSVALIFLAMPLAQNVDASGVSSWFDAPLAAYIFPLIGIFLAPIYPAINSTILTSLPIKLHGPMSGLIVVFSALGGTTGSIITGNLFEHIGGQNAFYFMIIPIIVLLITLFFFNRMYKSTTTN